MILYFSGNAVYGKCITNKEQYTKIEYVAHKDTSDFINNPLFQHLTAINDDLYEVQTRKPTVNHDLPIQIGFWVYSLAKMRMLEFSYDFLDKYFDRSKFELSQMDTDSRERHHWLPRTAVTLVLKITSCTKHQIKLGI